MKFLKLISLLLVIFIVILSSCPPVESMSDYIIICQSEAQGNSMVVVFDSNTQMPIANADVTINGVKCIYFFAYYPEAEIVVNEGDTVSYRVSIDGFEYVNSSIIIPDAAPVITAPTIDSEWVTEDSNSVTWTFDGTADEFEVSIDSFYTANEDRYSAIENNTTFSHIVPANTLASGMSSAAISVAANNRKTLSGEGLLFGSSIVGTTSTEVSFDIIMP